MAATAHNVGKKNDRNAQKVKKQARAVEIPKKSILLEKVNQSVLQKQMPQSKLQNPNTQQAILNNCKHRNLDDERIDIGIIAALNDCQSQIGSKNTNSQSKSGINECFVPYYDNVPILSLQFEMDRNISDTVECSAIDDNASLSFAYWKTGCRLASCGRYKESEESFLQSIKHDCSNDKAYNSYAIFLEQTMNDYKKADEYYQMALNINDSDPILWYNYGAFLSQTGKVELSRYCYHVGLCWAEGWHLKSRETGAQWDPQNLEYCILCLTKAIHNHV